MYDLYLASFLERKQHIVLPLKMSSKRVAFLLKGHCLLDIYIYNVNTTRLSQINNPSICPRHNASQSSALTRMESRKKSTRQESGRSDERRSQRLQFTVARQEAWSRHQLFTMH